MIIRGVITDSGLLYRTIPSEEQEVGWPTSTAGINVIAETFMHFK